MHDAIKDKLKSHADTVERFIDAIIPHGHIHDTSDDVVPLKAVSYLIDVEIEDDDILNEGGIVARVRIVPAIPHTTKGEWFEWMEDEDENKALEEALGVRLVIDCPDVDGEDGGMTVGSLVVRE